jgi:hypothetical protein
LLGALGAVEEPESIELDSDNGDNDDDDDDASVTDVAHPYFSAGGLQSWMDATDKTATGTGGDDASARSDIAPASVAAKLLPSAMDMQVACTVEDESASSGRLHGWRCDSTQRRRGSSVRALGSIHVPILQHKTQIPG